MNNESSSYTPEEAKLKLFSMYVLESEWDGIMLLDKYESYGRHIFRALIIIARGHETRDLYEVYEGVGGTMSYKAILGMLEDCS